MTYEMHDNHVQPGPDQATPADDAASADPEQIFADAMSRLESITQEWAEVVRSVQR